MVLLSDRRARRLVGVMALVLLTPWLHAQIARGAPTEGAGRPKARGLAFKTERVVVFKDGYGLFVKSGTATADSDGRVFSEDVPTAVLGTVWASSSDHELLSMTSGWIDELDERTDEVDCLSAGQILAVNPGRTVTLHTDKGDVGGRVVKVLEEPPAAVPVAPTARFAIATDIAAGPASSVSGGTPSLLVLDETPGGRLIMPLSSVISVAGKDLSTDCKRHTRTPHRTNGLTFDFGHSAAGREVKVHLFYFAPGVRWIPTYRIDTGSGSNAGIELQAEIINDVEDLHDTAVDLVVGVPNFRFKDSISPLSLEATLRQTLSQTAPALLSQSMQMTNGISSWTNGVGEDDARPAIASGALAMAPNMTGEEHQDLHVYAARSLTLEKGARAVVHLWSAKVPQRHLYTAELNVVRGPSYASGWTSQIVPPRGAPSAVEANNVWHQLELIDETDTPWTTGAALMMEGFLPIAQELLPYTSPGGRSRIPVTVAVDSRAHLEEKEIGRTPNALTVDKRTYVRIKKEGTVTLVNNGREKRSMRVSVETPGVAHAEGARVTQGEARASDWPGRGVDARVDSHSSIAWSVDVEPATTKTLTYEVFFYE